jgi:hypothetical protein
MIIFIIALNGPVAVGFLAVMTNLRHRPRRVLIRFFITPV